MNIMPILMNSIIYKMRMPLRYIIGYIDSSVVSALYVTSITIVPVLSHFQQQRNIPYINQWSFDISRAEVTNYTFDVFDYDAINLFNVNLKNTFGDYFFCLYSFSLYCINFSSFKAHTIISENIFILITNLAILVSQMFVAHFRNMLK